jgi:hypothetical protein
MAAAPIDWLPRYQDALRRQGTDPAPLAARADTLVHAAEADFLEAVRAFHAAADASDYAYDSDYGALLLEAAAEHCADLPRRRDLLSAAVGRAQRFAGWATAGGEGLARMLDATRMSEALLRVIREIESEAPPTHEFDAYRRMRDDGRSAAEARARAASDGLDRIDTIRMLRDVFHLSLDEALRLLSQ